MGDQQKGILLITASALFFALMSAFASLAGELPFFQKALFRNAVSLVAAGSVMMRDRAPVKIPREHWPILSLRILLGMGGIFGNYYAINHLLLANSNSLNKLSPFFAILVSAVFMKEMVGGRQLACIGIALIGSAFLIFPNMDTFGFASFIGLLGGACAGSAQAVLRALIKKSNLNNSTLVFVFSAVSTIVALVPSIFFWEPMALKQLLFMTLAGGMCAVAQYAMTAAYRHASPKDISIYDSSQIIFSAVFGYILFDQIPAATDLIAYILIISSAALLFVYHKKQKPSIHA